MLGKPVQNTKHHEQVLDAKIEKISKEKMNASNYSQPDLNGKVSETNTRQMSKKEIKN